MSIGKEEIKVLGWMLALPLLLGAMGNGVELEPRLVASEITRTATLHAHTAVNVRSGPSTLDDVVGQLKSGDAVEVTRGGGEWTQIIEGPHAGAHVYTPALSSDPPDQR